VEVTCLLAFYPPRLLSVRKGGRIVACVDICLKGEKRCERADRRLPWSVIDGWNKRVAFTMVMVMMGKIEGEGMDGGEDVWKGRGGVGLDWVDLGVGLIE